MEGRPAHTCGDGGLVKFALDHELGASVIKTEDLVVDVEPVHDKTQAVAHFDATLGIELKMGIEVVVAEGTGSAVPVARDILSVIGKAYTNRDAAAIIGGADVPGVGRVANKPRMIRSTEIWSKGRARSGVTVVCGDAQTSECAGQEGEVLQIGSLETIDPGTTGVHRLRDAARCRCAASRTAEGSCRDVIKYVRNDGLRQILVKITRRDDSEGAEVMLEEHIDVIGGFGF